jgi:hypothetical protein
MRKSSLKIKETGYCLTIIRKHVAVDRMKLSTYMFSHTNSPVDVVVFEARFTNVTFPGPDAVIVNGPVTFAFDVVTTKTYVTALWRGTVN